MVVGEVSGENLALPLIQSLRSRSHFDSVNFSGVLGEKLIAAGGQALFPMDRLSVVGLIEPLFRIPELFRIRSRLIQQFLKNPPDVFIGVDAPDFNLGLERILKSHGIPTVHYVSPTVWAWRQGRIHKIKKAVDLMLALFPFEAKFYEKHDMPVCFTGHPLADQIPLEGEKDLKERSVRARKILGLDLDKPLVSLLPGSRDREIASLSEIYLNTAKWCYQQERQLQFVAALVKEKHKEQFIALHQRIAPEIPIVILAQQQGLKNEGHGGQDRCNTTRLALEACDVALVKAGTATLEVMLHKKPMVVSYRVHPITYQLVKRLIKVPWVALPNLLAEEQLVPEFLQQDMQPEMMGRALLALLEEGGGNGSILHSHKAGQKWLRVDKTTGKRNGLHPLTNQSRVFPAINRPEMIERFSELHDLLRRGASDRAAEAIEQVLKDKKA